MDHLPHMSEASDYLKYTELQLQLKLMVEEKMCHQTFNFNTEENQIINPEMREKYEACIFCYNIHNDKQHNSKADTKYLHIGNCKQPDILNFRENLTNYLESILEDLDKACNRLVKYSGKETYQDVTVIGGAYQIETIKLSWILQMQKKFV